MEDLKVILIVLEKAEQILSFVNLPDSTLRKYNELKELCCGRLGIDFIPLEKGKGLYSTQGKLNEIGNISNISIDIQGQMNRLKDIIQKKDILIGYLIDKLMKNDNDNSSITSIFENVKLSKFKLEELEFIIKSDDQVLTDQINKIERLSMRKNHVDHVYHMNNMSSNSNNHISSLEMNEIIFQYERNIEELKKNHEKEIQNLLKKQNDTGNTSFYINNHLKTPSSNKYHQSEYGNIKGNSDYTNLNEEIEKILFPLYEKFNTKDMKIIIENENFIEKPKRKDLEKMVFLLNVLVKFYNDNKYLVEIVSELEGKVNKNEKEKLLPHVSNAIQRNEKLVSLKYEIDKMENLRKEAKNKFLNLIGFINMNFKDKEIV